MKYLFFAIALVIAISVLPGCDQTPSATDSPAQSTAAIAWFDGDVEAAFTAARTEHKPLLLYWGAEWCPYCTALRTTVFTRTDFIEKSRAFVPVYLDGDLPGAQRWGESLKVAGYPTLLVLRPDRTEIARISGGIDLAQYAVLLDDVLEDERPAADILTVAVDGPADAPISSEDCRRLAYHGWDLYTDIDRNPTDLANHLTLAAARCPVDQAVPRARLSVYALSFALQSESAALEQNKSASIALDERIRALAMLLNEREQVRGAIDILAGLDSVLYKVVTAQGSGFADRFRDAWIAAMLDAAGDNEYGSSERLLALANALEGAKELRPDHLIPTEMQLNAREQIDIALRSDRDRYSRGDIVNAARIVYAVLGDDDAAHELLEKELADTKTPYYYLSALAALDEKNGRIDQAITNLSRAYVTAREQGPATRIQWGDSYVRGMIRLTPNDISRIQSVALEVVDSLDGPNAVKARNGTRLTRMQKALTEWATTPERQQVVTEIRQRLDKGAVVKSAV